VFTSEKDAAKESGVFPCVAAGEKGESKRGCANEHDEDPEMRPEQREDVIVHMAAGLLGAYQYFRA